MFVGLTPKSLYDTGWLLSTLTFVECFSWSLVKLVDGGVGPTLVLALLEGGFSFKFVYLFPELGFSGTLY